MVQMPVRLNTALYFTDYKNLQKASVDTYDAPGPGLPQIGASVVNAGAAQLYGLEVEATIQPFTGATLVGTYAYTHAERSEEHTSELQSLMRISYAVFCLKKKNTQQQYHKHIEQR